MPHLRQAGTTLPEITVVLAIIAILLAIAVPGLSAQIRVSGLTGATQDMLASLHLARSEAIKRRSRAVICVTADGNHCAEDGGWHQGWIVFHDVNNNAERETDEVLILARGPLVQGLAINGNLWVTRYISYASTGQTRLVSGALQPGTLTFCLDGGPARQIVISATGRPRTVRLDACPP